MIIIPAIDIKDGNVVRLEQGKFSTETVYDTDPVSVAKKFEEQGAKWVHVIDLDGAETGRTKNISIIERIVNETNLSVQVGGGVRSITRLLKLIEIGVDRIIIGTLATRQRALLKELVAQYPENILVAVDSNNGFVTDHGWQRTSDIETLSFCQELQELGVKTIVYTDISKDGMMEGPNLEDYQTLCDTTKLNVIASGGVSSMEDIRKLKELNLYGAIIGKALYLENIKLEEALACSQEE